jgi:hypothetical protein
MYRCTFYLSEPRRRWVESFMSLPHNPNGKSPQYPLDRGWVGFIARLHDLEKWKFLNLSGLELRSLGRPARSQSLYRLHHNVGSQMGIWIVLHKANVLFVIRNWIAFFVREGIFNSIFYMSYTSCYYQLTGMIQVAWDTTQQARKSRVRFPMKSLNPPQWPNLPTTRSSWGWQSVTDISARNLPVVAYGWQLLRHLWACCVENVRSSTSHNPMGLHSQLYGYLYFVSPKDLLKYLTLIHC